jgi:hypothetical protein
MVQQYVMFSSIRTLNFIILTINYQPDLHRRRLQFIYQFLRQQCEGHEDIPPAEDGAEDDIWRKMQIESLALFNSLKVMGATHEEIITDVNDEVKAWVHEASLPKYSEVACRLFAPYSRKGIRYVSTSQIHSLSKQLLTV